MRLKREHYRNMYQNGMAAAGIAAGIYLAFRFVLPLVFPFLLAGIVSVLYYPLLRNGFGHSHIWRGKNKRWFLMLAVLVFYALVLALLVLSGIFFVKQLCRLLSWLPVCRVQLEQFLMQCCGRMDHILQIQGGSCAVWVQNCMGGLLEDPAQRLASGVTGVSVRMAGGMAGILFQGVIAVIATFFMIQDYDRIREKLVGSDVGRRLCGIVVACRDTLKTYWKAQGVILILDGLLCTLAFLLSGQAAFWILGPLVAFVDALPVFGAGLILLPYTGFFVITGQHGNAAILAIAYMGCVVIRQTMEPRMIGKKVGVSPLLTILSMYAGYRLFGVTGFLLGPVGLLLGKELYAQYKSCKYEAEKL